MGGRGSAGGRRTSTGGSGRVGKQLFSTDKNGIRTYTTDEEGARAFQDLSESSVHWNKGAYISKTTKEQGAQVKRSEMFDYLKRRDINSFILTVPKGQEKKALKQLSDYGYNVVAKSGFNVNATAIHHDVQYFVSKKEMQYLGLDFKVKKYYKRGWKG